MNCPRIWSLPICENGKNPPYPNGKINKKALPVPDFKTNAAFESPRDDVDERLAAVWSQVLAIERDAISIDADFFDLGGHSLKATILISRIQNEFDIDMAIVDILKAPPSGNKLNTSRIPLMKFLGNSPKPGTAEKKIQESRSSLFRTRWHRWSRRIYWNFVNIYPYPLNSTVGDFVPPAWRTWPPELDHRRIGPNLPGKNKKIQPPDQGPYYIVGWSLGGTIAFEMVKQLEQEKEKIGLLALIDSYPPQPSSAENPSPFDLQSELQVIRSYAKQTHGQSIWR